MLKADEVECRDSDERREQDDGSDVLNHAELVILRFPWGILVSRQIEQFANIAPGLVSGALMLSLGTLAQPELQYLAAAVVFPLWLAARHLMPNAAFSS